MSETDAPLTMTKWLASLPTKVAHRLARAGGVRGHLLGLLLRARLDHAGVLTVMGGWHIPEIDNRGGTIAVGDCGFWPGVRLECWRGARIVIGDGTYLNRGTEIVAAVSVTIGRDSAIGRDVILMDTDQHALPGEDFDARPVVIEDRVWIGARSIVLKGVTIGHDSVVGAGSVVTSDIPPFSIAVGHPASVLRSVGSLRGQAPSERN